MPLGPRGSQAYWLIGGPLKVSNGKARWEGFLDALKANDLVYDSTLMIEGDYRVESGYRAGHLLLSHRPDGIYVANYLMTVGLLKAAEEMGLRCPEDFGLVSFDDYPWLGIFRPRLTTVELPKYQLGSEAAELLLDRIAGKTGPGSSVNFFLNCGLGSPADSNFKPQSPDRRLTGVIFAINSRVRRISIFLEVYLASI